MSESLQKTLYVKLQELIAFQSEGEWDDATVNADARDFTAELMPIFAALEAERDALRADAARYRWMRENGRMGYIWNAALHEHEKEGRRDVDAVIDAERGAQS